MIVLVWHEAKPDINPSSEESAYKLQIIIINNNNQFLYTAFTKSMTKIKALPIYYYHCQQEIITIILLHLGVL